MSDLVTKIKSAFSIKIKPISFLFLLFGLVIGLLLFPQLAQAGFWADLGKAIVNQAFKLLLKMTEPFLEFSYLVLSWVMSDSFITVSYTGPDNFIVHQGWTVMRNFANMFFIIGLVVIGIATALRYRDYQAQKALPKLIIIALLINFTPAICGAIIDASNLAMNHFKEVGFTKEISDWISGNIKALQDKTDIWQEIGMGVMLVAFNLIATLIFLLYAVLFAVRYVALWILVILSPLAFLCYIFSFTRKFWTEWWNQFIQWCIVGIPAMLTLYLANLMVTRMRTQTIVGEPGWGGTFAKFTSFVAMYSVPIIFLIVGFLISLRTSAMGAQTTINVSKKAGRAAVAGAAGVTAAAAPGAPARVKKRLEAMQRSQPPEEEEIEGKGAIRRGMAKMGKALGTHPARRAMAGWALRRMKTESEQIEEESKKGKESSTRENLAAIQNPALPRATRIGRLLGAIKAGQLKTLRKMGLTKAAIAKLGKKAVKAAPEKAGDIAKTRPDIGWEIAKGLSEAERERADLTVSKAEQKDLFTEYELEKFSEQEIQQKGVTRKITAGLSPKDIESLDLEALDNPEVEEAVHRFWSPAEWSKFGREFGRAAIDKLNQGAQIRGQNYYEEFNQERLLNYFRGPGQDLGFEMPPEQGEQEVIVTPPPRARPEGYTGRGVGPGERREAPERPGPRPEGGYTGRGVGPGERREGTEETREEEEGEEREEGGYTGRGVGPGV